MMNTSTERYQKSRQPWTLKTSGPNRAGAWCMWFHPGKYDSGRWPERETLEALVHENAVELTDSFPPPLSWHASKGMGYCERFVRRSVDTGSVRTIHLLRADSGEQAAVSESLDGPRTVTENRLFSRVNGSSPPGVCEPLFSSSCSWREWLPSLIRVDDPVQVVGWSSPGAFTCDVEPRHQSGANPCAEQWSSALESP